MKILSMKKEDRFPYLEYGMVRQATENGFVVITDSYEVEAEVAISCLVRPEPGDTVLLSMDDRGFSYILSILERPEERGKTTVLTFEGDVSVQVRKGGMQVATERDIRFATGEFELNAHDGKLCLDSLSFAGRVIKSQIERIKIIADAVDTIIKRTVQRLRTSYRYVEEHEEIQSASTRMLVDGTLTMQTKNTMHIAEGHIKIDAEQIHLG